MALTIGRVGNDIALAEPDSWSESGDGTVSISGTTRGLTVEDASMLREQLLGLADPFGEPFVPVTVGYDDERDGWYTVLDVGVEHMIGATENLGTRRWDMTLRRLPYRQQPRYELHRYGGVWTNDHSITTSTYDGFVALPSTVSAVDLGDTSFSVATRNTDTGSLSFYYGVDSYDTVVSAYLPMADAYDGAAKIEVDIDGSNTWRTVVGTDVRHLPTRWRIGNGIMRCTWNTTEQGFDVEIYDPTSPSWENVGEASSVSNYFLLTDAAASYLAVDPVSVTVLRNDPLACTLRLVMDYDSGKSRVFVDVSVRRGDRNVSFILKSRESQTWGVEPDAAAGTAVAGTGMYRASANDDSGNRYVVTIPKTYTLNTSTGASRLTSASTVFPFAIGCEVNGSSATGQNTAQQVAYQHYSQAAESLFIAKP